MDDVIFRCLPAYVFAAAQMPRLDRLRDTSVEARARNLCRKSYDTEISPIFISDKVTLHVSRENSAPPLLRRLGKMRRRCR
jgi:hypothetical protein